MSLAESLLNEERTIYTDNCYTSGPLAYRLRRRNTHLVGTFRTNRKYLTNNVINANLKRREMSVMQIKCQNAFDRYKGGNRVIGRPPLSCSKKSWNLLNCNCTLKIFRDPRLFRLKYDPPSNSRRNEPIIKAKCISETNGSALRREILLNKKLNERMERKCVDGAQNAIRNMKNTERTSAVK